MQFRINRESCLVGAGLAMTFIIFMAQGGFTPDMSNSTRNYYIIGMVALALIALFLSAKRTKPEPQPIIESRKRNRKTYLPQLKDATNHLISLADIKTREASDKSLAWYRETYLVNSIKYHYLKRLISMCFNKNGSVLLGLILDGFTKKNAYYLELKKKDDWLNSKNTYNDYRSQNKDKVLGKLLAHLLKMMDEKNSSIILTELARKNLAKNSWIVTHSLKIQDGLENDLTKKRQQVDNRFYELLKEGVPDE